ncbi:hypothetical protein INT47_010345, partial [Mucor saturninus]
MNPERQSVEDKKEYTNEEKQRFEIEERVQAALPENLVASYKSNRTIPFLPSEQRIPSTQKREEHWSHHAKKLVATLTGKSEAMSKNPDMAEMANTMADAFKRAIASQKPSGERIRQPECYHGERSAMILDGWLRSVERYTEYYEFTAEKTMLYAVNLLRGRADVWWQHMERKASYPSAWKPFKEAIIEEFRPAHTLRSARDRLANLSQTRTVLEYVDEFRNIQLEIPSMTNEEAQDRFVRGLQQEVRLHVITLTPTDVDEAMQMAQTYESSRQLGHPQVYYHQPQQYQYQPQPQQYQQQFHYQPQPYQYQSQYRMQEPVPMEIDAIDSRRRFQQRKPAYNRSEVICHWCNKAGHMQRQCRQRLAAIKQLDEENRKKQGFREAQPMEEKSSPEASKNNEISYTAINKETCDSYSYVSNEPELLNTPTSLKEMTEPHLMADQTFLEGLYAAVDTDLPLYPAMLDDKLISVLIDSGASANYVSPQIAQSAQNLVSISGRPVETAGGHTLSIDQKATLSLSLSGYTDTIDAYVFPTKFDLILGRTWLQQARPIPDWQTDTWYLHRNGVEFVLQPQCPRKVKPQLNYLVSAKQVQKLVGKEEAACFLLHIKSKLNTNNDDSQWNDLVKEFSDVFQDGLPGLPPDREVQH